MAWRSQRRPFGEGGGRQVPGYGRMRTLCGLQVILLVNRRDLDVLLERGKRKQ